MKSLKALIELYLQLRPPDVRRVFVVVEFARSPKSFHQALLRDPQLVRCREALLAAKLPLEIGDKAQLLLSPEHVNMVIEHINANGVTFRDGLHVSADGLKPRHLVCSEGLFIYALNAVAEIKRKEKVKVKRQVAINVWENMQVGGRRRVGADAGAWASE